MEIFCLLLLACSLLQRHLPESLGVSLFICFSIHHASAMEAAVLDDACQCLCVELIFSYSGSYSWPPPCSKLEGLCQPLNLFYLLFFSPLLQKKKLGPGLDFLLSTPGVHVLT